MRRCAMSWSFALRMLGLVLVAGCAAEIPAPEWQVEGRAPDATRDFAFPEGAEQAPAAPEPPLSLTASYGTCLRLVEIEARAVVEEPLAFTELRLVFDNPEARRLEGTFSITLPEGAAISRLSMKIGDAWQEGEVVEKQSARRAYEDFLHRRQDPALLEQAAGNQFSARVFPIQPRARKELIVSYSQELAGGRPYALPLRGLPELGRLSVSVMLAGEATPAEQVDRTNVTPGADLLLDPGRLRGGAGLRSGNLVLARVRPIPAAEPDPFSSTIVLVDTSASRALGFEEQVRLVGRLARRIAESAGARTPLAVGAFDQAAAPIFEGDAGAFGEGELRRLRERQAFGASNLEGALGWAEARAQARGYKRVILVGDGVATAGDVDASGLAARAARLRTAGVERLDAVVVGGIRDEAALKKLATAGLARDGVVADGALDPAALERKLTQTTRSGIPVAIEGARWQWPVVLDGVQAGDEVLVYADVPDGQPVRVSVGGATSPALALTQVERPLLERSWAKARIESLLEGVDEDGPRADVAREVVALSTTYRVLSPYTSLLVLETDADFTRFGLDRKGLADILTVDTGRLSVGRLKARPGSGPAAGRSARRRRARGEGGCEARRTSDARSCHRARRWPGSARPRVGGFAPSRAMGEDAASARGEHVGIGHRRLVRRRRPRARGRRRGRRGPRRAHRARHDRRGRARRRREGRRRERRREQGGGQGLGSGHGRLAGAHRAGAPQVRVGASQVSGRLPPEVIQRIVRQNFGRLRACYEEGLRLNPNLQGRVAVRFVIQRDGTVGTSEDAGSDLPDGAVVACVARSMTALSFPVPEGGIITVTYPLVFTPSDGTASSPADPVVTLPPTAITPNRHHFDPPSKPSPVEPYTGHFRTVMDLLGAGGVKPAIDVAYAWHREAPGDVMALVALGEALERARANEAAARVYGSIVDLFPARADLRRFAGERLERLGAAGSDEALDTFLKAEDERPDHPESHRLVAYALLRRGDHAGAFAAAVRGKEQRYPPGRFRGVDQILREDLGLIAAAWIKAEPGRRGGDPGEARGGRRRPRGRALAALPPELGDGRERRRLPHPRRGGRPRVLLRSGAAERGPPLRRRHHRVRPRVLHHPAARGEALGELPPGRPLLLSWPHGLRDGQARDRRPRRQGRPHLLGAPLRGDGGRRARRPRHREPLTLESSGVRRPIGGGPDGAPGAVVVNARAWTASVRSTRRACSPVRWPSSRGAAAASGSPPRGRWPSSGRRWPSAAARPTRSRRRRPPSAPTASPATTCSAAPATSASRTRSPPSWAACSSASAASTCS